MRDIIPRCNHITKNGIVVSTFCHSEIVMAVRSVVCISDCRNLGSLLAVTPCGLIHLSRAKCAWATIDSGSRVFVIPASSKEHDGLGMLCDQCRGRVALQGVLTAEACMQFVIKPVDAYQMRLHGRCVVDFQHKFLCKRLIGRNHIATSTVLPVSVNPSVGYCHIAIGIRIILRSVSYGEVRAEVAAIDADHHIALTVIMRLTDMN